MNPVPADTEKATGPWHCLKVAGVFALLLAIAWVAFSPAIHGPFVFDDLPGIRDNTHLRQILPLSRSLGAPQDTAPYGRPGVALFLALEYHFFGLMPTGYHLTSLLLHVLNALLIWALLKRLLQPTMRWARLLIPLLWVVHPIQTDAVAYASQQTGLLMACFFLLTLNAWIRRWFGLAILTCAVGMTFKQSMAVTPLIIWLMDRTWGEKYATPEQPWRPDAGFRKLGAHFRGACFREAGFRGAGQPDTGNANNPPHLAQVGLMLTWLIIAGLQLAFPRTQSAGFGADLAQRTGVTAWTYLLTQSRVICHYLQQAIWPTRLALDPDFPIATHLREVWLTGLILLLLLGWSGRAWLRGHRRVGFWGLWFFLLLAPTSSFVPIVTEIAADRRMYLPLLALVWGLAYVITKINTGRLACHRVKQSLLVLPVLILMLSCRKRSEVYQSPIRLYEDTVAKYPDNLRAWRNLASWSFTQGRYARAEEAYRHVLHRAPWAKGIRHDLGMTLVKRGRLDAALRQFQAQARSHPEDVINLNELGTTLAKLKRLKDAIRVLKQGLRLEPNNPRLLDNLAKLYSLNHQPQQALAARRRLIMLRPNDASAYNDLGVVLAQQKQYDQAQNAFEQAVQHDPNHADARANLAKIKRVLQAKPPRR